MPGLSYGDFTPLTVGGKRDQARRYVSPSTGEVISLRQFQKGARGGVSYEQYQRQRASQGVLPRRYKLTQKSDLTLYVENVNRTAARDGLPFITEKDAAASPEFKLLRRWIRSKDASPKGKRAQALVMLGLREPWWEWDVGETPRK